MLFWEVDRHKTTLKPSDLPPWQRFLQTCSIGRNWAHLPPWQRSGFPQKQGPHHKMCWGGVGGWKLGKWWCGGLRGKKYFDDLLTGKNLSPPQLFISAHTGTVLGVSERIVRRGQSRCEPGSTRFISMNPSALTQSCHRRAVTAVYHHAATLLVGLVGRTNRYQPDCSTRGLLCAA